MNYTEVLFYTFKYSSVAACKPEDFLALISDICGDRVSCLGNSDDILNGKCVCGKTEACSLPESNRCQDGNCMCGSQPSCNQASFIPSCRESNGNKPTDTSTTATCQVNVIYLKICYRICYMRDVNSIDQYYFVFLIDSIFYTTSVLPFPACYH